MSGSSLLMGGLGPDKAGFRAVVVLGLASTCWCVGQGPSLLVSWCLSFQSLCFGLPVGPGGPWPGNYPLLGEVALGSGVVLRLCRAGSMDLWLQSPGLLELMFWPTGGLGWRLGCPSAGVYELVDETGPRTSAGPLVVRLVLRSLATGPWGSWG